MNRRLLPSSTGSAAGFRPNMRLCHRTNADVPLRAALRGPRVDPGNRRAERKRWAHWSCCRRAPDSASGEA